MLITTIVGNITHLEALGDIVDFYGEDANPQDISYSETSINVGGYVLKVENGRYAFAQALDCFEEPEMLDVYTRNYYCANTMFLGEYEIGAYNSIGKAGFGFENGLRIKHLGNVIIGKNVSIGSNVCIDRGVIDSTVIGDNTKIDNLVHVAHGVIIGNDCLIVAGTVIGGSVKIGNNCFLGINCSIKNKVTIGNNVTIGMGSVVLSDVPDNTVVKGLWK